MTATRLRNLAFSAILLSLPAFASVDSALLALVPPNTTVIAGARVDEVKSSQFGQFVLRNMQMDGDEFQKFIQETGFDPRRDLREVVMATMAAGQNEFDRTIVIGKGVFNPARIVSAAKGLGAEVTSYQGVEMLVHREGNHNAAVAFLDAGLAVMGDSAMVKQAIERRGKGTSLTPQMQSKVASVSAQNQIWFYSAVSPASLFAGHISDPNLGGAVKGGLMESVTQASGGLRFEAKAVKITGEAVARSDKDASALADVFKFLVGIMSSHTDAGTAQPLIEGLDVKSDGNVMKLSMSMSESALETLFGDGGRRKVKQTVKSDVVD